jgi:mono/diheme cytochrome c family protein
MNKEPLQLELFKLIKKLVLSLFLLALCIGSLGFISMFKVETDIDKKVTTVDQLKIAPEVQKGKSLFINNCAQCHANDMKTKLTGPALSGVESRWNDKTAIADWIRKGAVSESQQSYMELLKKEFDNVPMPRFGALQDAEIEAILAYIRFKSK